jgi:hypothetical protein
MYINLSNKFNGRYENMSFFINSLLYTRTYNTLKLPLLVLSKRFLDFMNYINSVSVSKLNQCLNYNLLKIVLTLHCEISLSTHKEISLH